MAGPMKRRDDMCNGCPFNARRIGLPIPSDVRQVVGERIRAGEAWVCHQTCDGPRVVMTSMLCAGAPAVITSPERKEVRYAEG